MIAVDEKDLKLVIESKASLLLTEVSDFLTEQNVRWYVVGGFVRDLLLGRATADIDIAVAADALEIAQKAANTLGGKYVLLDKENRMGRVVLVDEKAPSGGQWELDFTTFEGNIEQDLVRRDFTIDAMAVDLLEVERGHIDVRLIDPFNGQSDLQQGVVRVVTDTAFTSDAVRLLRAVRLAAELDFSISHDTEALIRRHSHLTSEVAAERVREELLRILAVPRSDRLLPYLEDLGLLTAIIPELAQTRGVTQPKEHFWNVFEHSLMTVAAVDFLLRQGKWEYAGEEVLAAVPWSSVLAQHFTSGVSRGSNRRVLLKLAALLHDIAKPQTKATEANGRTHFLGHAREGATTAAAILERLRFSGKEIKMVEMMIEHHMRPTQMTQEKLPSNRAIYRYFRDTGDAGIDILFLSLADHLATRGPNLILTGWQEHVDIVNYVLNQRFQEKSPVMPPRLIDGHDLIDIFGMSPGPEVGELLEAVREAQAAGELGTREDALAYLRERLSKETG